MARTDYSVLELTDTKNLPTVQQIKKVFGEEVPDFLAFAAAAGWKIIFNSTGSNITLVAPGERDKMHLSNRHKGRHSLNRYYKRVIKHADPLSVARFRSVIEGYDPEIVRAVVSTLPSVVDMAVVEEAQPEPEFIPPSKPVKKTEAAKAEEMVAEAEAKVQKERYIVSERPALMHRGIGNRGIGRSYPSQTTIERRWSDGSVDYACAVPTCDATSTNRRAFGGPHWGMHIRKGEAEQVPENIPTVDDPSYTEPAFTKQDTGGRKASLIAFLSGIDLQKTTPEDLADMLLEWLGDTGHGATGPREPLTPEEIINRIRALVDRGHYAEQDETIREQQVRIEELIRYSEQHDADVEARVAEAEQRSLIAEQRAIKAESTLRALGELAAEYRSEE